MKILLLCTAVCLVFSACCAQTSTTEQPTVREQPLELESALLDEQYMLFTAQVLEMPLGENRYILARHADGEELQIQSAEAFSQIMKEIASPEDALEFARLITSQEVRPFLEDIYYHEVHEKYEPETDEPVEILKAYRFAIEPEQYEEWELSEPVVTEHEDGGYTIERFVASYPQTRIEEGKEPQITPAQLLKVREQISPEGGYVMEILDTITEGEPVHGILHFTK